VAKPILDPRGAGTVSEPAAPFDTNWRIVRMTQFVDVQCLRIVSALSCASVPRNHLTSTTRFSGSGLPSSIRTM
jgi:hypothetical protein